MKKFIFVITFFMLGNLYAELGQRHLEKEGGFSFCPPQEWQISEYPGMKFHVVLGPVENSFRSNINVVDETNGEPLKIYVDNNLKQIEKIFEQFKLIKREPFTTKSKIKGEKIITTALQQKNLLRQTYYFVSGKNGKKLVITCTTLEQNKDSLDPTFDESFKSFEYIK